MQPTTHGRTPKFCALDLQLKLNFPKASPVTPAARCANHLTTYPSTPGQKEGLATLKAQSSGQHEMGTHTQPFLTRAMHTLWLNSVASTLQALDFPHEQFVITETATFSPVSALEPFRIPYLD